MENYTQEQRSEMIDRANKKNFVTDIHFKKNGDSHDVHFIDRKSGERVGYGYIGKRDNKDGKISLIRCPACRRENYAMNVSSGYCTWCPFDANAENEV